MSNIRLYALSALALATQSAFGQHVVKGQVIDATTREPLVGVTVTLPNTKQGVTTDADGNFALSVKELPTTLNVSYVGYNSTTLDVYDDEDAILVEVRENRNRLDEVVVTALGISREKKSLGYSAQEVTADALTSTKDNNFLNSLSGKVAGLRITGSAGDLGSSRIIIRGETSIAGENQPLFIVDGIPVDNSRLNSQSVGRDFKNAISDLSADDIESITVLKGPNAAALYGSRAAHGAIIITTKTGKGQQKGLGISFSSSNRISTAATLPEYQNLYGQGADGQFSYVDGKGGGVNDGVDESWGPRLDIGLLIPQFDSPVDEDGNRTATPWVSHPNNVSDFFRTGFTTTNSISIARSDDKYQFRLGYNYEYQKSIVPYASTNKSNFTVNTDYKLASWLSVGLTGNYIIYTSPALPGNSGRSNSTMLQFLWFGRQVDLNSLKEDYSRNWNNSYYSNPYWNAKYNTQSQERHRLIGDVHADFTITPDLHLRLRTSTDWYNDRRKAKVKWGTNGTPYGKYSEDAYTVQEKNSEALLTYQHTFGDFTVDGLVGFNVRNKQYENNYQEAPRLAVADLYTLTNSRDQLTSENEYSRLRVYSVYAQASVGYKNWAYLTLTGRNDWSSTLPVDNNSYFYPSITASVLLDEAFHWHNRQLNYLKLRGGWSQVGSDADPYQLATVYTSETAFNSNPLQTSSGEGKNPNLKPERTTSVEVGLESAFFDNRLSFDLAYYQTDSKDQIIRLATTAASGYTSQVRNAGHIRNRGFEASAEITPIRTKDWKWDVRLNYGRNKSKVIELDKEGLITSYTIGDYSAVQILATVGQEYGTIYGTTYVRDDQGRIVVDDSGLPRVSSTSSTLGKAAPDWTGGIQNTITYKDFSLSFLIDASIGGQIYSSTNRTGNYTGVLASTLQGRDEEHGGLWYYKDASGTNVLIDRPDYTISSNGLYYADINGTNTRVYQDGIIVDGVTSSGETNTTITSAENYYHRIYSIAEANVWDADYVKLREVVIGWKVPRRITRRLHLQEANLSLTARNLWIIYKDVPNIDPELAYGTGNAQGYESLALPTTRQWSINLSVKF